LMPLKVLTSEIIFLKPLTKYFIPCAYNDPNSPYDINNWDPNFENYIEILVDENALIAPEIVKSKVCAVLEQFFDENNQTIGNLIDLNILTSNIFSVEGVKRIRTVYVPTIPGTNRIINGLRFACWTNSIVEGADLDYITGTHQLELFQFPEYLETNFQNRVKVIVDSAIPATTVEY